MSLLLSARCRTGAVSDTRFSEEDGWSVPRPFAKRCFVGANASRARRVLDAVLPLPVDVLMAAQGRNRSVSRRTAGDRYQDRRVTAFRALGDRSGQVAGICEVSN